MSGHIVKDLGETPSVNKQQITGAVPDTLIANIERVVNTAINTRMLDSVYANAAEPLEYLSQRLGITPRQALLFSLVMELSNSNRIDCSDLAHLVNCRRVRMISLMVEDKALLDRGLIRIRRSRDEVEYRVPKDVVNAIKDNNFSEIKKTGLTIDQFFEALERIMDEADDSPETLPDNIRYLIEDNTHLEFSRRFKRYFGDYAHNPDGILFMIFAHRLVNLDDDCIGEHNWEDYFPKGVLRLIRHELADKSSQLLKDGLLEELGSNGMRDNYYYRLSNKAKEEFFVGLENLKTENSRPKELQSCQDFAKKSLVYNQREGGQIAQLSSLISVSNFAKVQHRLEANGMRKGFACLFYGAPGTGKTETVYQLARKTRRDLFVIDVAKIKSCWVGESEKNITQAFANYRSYVAQCRQNGTHIPILLFNEADAVLGIRKTGAESAVDKMENSIQNIILQEMERLDGIMIATTNLTANLDSAFERRFIYKVEFEKPTVEARSSIWRSMVPGLSPSVARKLAEEFDFSGGQIENVARKRTVDMCLTGQKPTPEQLRAYCQQEQIHNQKHTRIGF